MGHGPWVMGHLVLFHEKKRFSGTISSRWPPVLFPAVGLWYFRFFFRPVLFSASLYRSNGVLDTNPVGQGRGMFWQGKEEERRGEEEDGVGQI